MNYHSFPNAISISLAPDATKALVEYPQGNGTTELYDIGPAVPSSQYFANVVNGSLTMSTPPTGRPPTLPTTTPSSPFVRTAS